MPYLNYWERKGKAEGLVEGKAEVLLRQIKAKFGQIPAWAEEKLFGAEEATLDTWSLNILTKDSLEDVFST